VFWNRLQTRFRTNTAMSTISPPPVATNTASLAASIEKYLRYTFGLRPKEASEQHFFRACALAIRELMLERMFETERRYHEADAKRVYYLSMEFLIGRCLRNNVLSLGILDTVSGALRELGSHLERVESQEADAALGNGGLGRLAACFLDSLATLDMPGYGCGLLYDYGLFRQEIQDGQQVERPDQWLGRDSPWLIERASEPFVVPIYGRVEHGRDARGGYNPMWLDWKVMIGVPYDMPIVGYGGRTVNRLRLFQARSSEEFDIDIFQQGDYIQAVQEKIRSETVSKLLYPSENVRAGRELRLVQEYFLVACAIRDLFRRFQRSHRDVRALPSKVAIQLNDTHPALAIAELMRVLVDENDIPWDEAWELTQATCAYTNHTLLPEALERWPVAMLEQTLPRHLQIIYEINRLFLNDVRRKWLGDIGRVQKLSLIEEEPQKSVRMAHLAICGSHSVNGVAALHTRLIQKTLAPDFNEMWPERFNNKTNGVTHRRWLLYCNPLLSRLLLDAIGDGWIRDPARLQDLEPFAGDSAFQARFRQAKRGNKEVLGARIFENTWRMPDPASLFDVQIKRIHEYKRQLLAVLHIIHCYFRIVEDGVEPAVPRTFVFAGKAAPGYFMAKLIIKMIHDVAAVVNQDPRSSGKLHVVFIPDFKVSLGELIYPAADLSEQISTAGKEASGTGNMKFMLNGALTIGTLDGANVEIQEAVGPENIYIFGLTADQILLMRQQLSYNPWDYYHRSPAVRRIMDAIRDNRFCPTQPGLFRPIYDGILYQGDPYFHLADLEDYIRTQEQVSADYQDSAAWTRKAILNVARAGSFSSDRAIWQYAQEIWGIKSWPPAPGPR
jgi:starch phosphorylase